MIAATGDIIDQAIGWHIRLPEASADDWHDFVLWLEADEAHRTAYDRVVMDDAQLAPSLELDETPVPANDVAPSRTIRRWSMMGGGALVAALMVAVLLPSQKVASSYKIETAPGATRTVKLDDGTTIEMNGGTRMSFRKDDARYASLEAGEATFHVRHDAEHPFELQSGSYAVRDLGTVFNVTREGPRMAVQVAEGSVLFAPDRHKITLTPGMTLAARDGDTQPVVGTVAAESVGGWRHGVVTFRDAPIEAVASAVSRATGAKLVVDPALAQRGFTGTLHLTGKPENAIPRVAALIDADWRRVGGNWMLTPKGDATR